ncbi:hypothetical protein EC957_009455 [Mortierella hygrophila]|uniref:Uncharacterized protein n=1 Tax=Mortierella hygrophila TaxID=979708 RepID=A0A9P6K534_9FUNG|nr:hypothetical protein EC957_009455 [Mortierella hygrophila]
MRFYIVILAFSMCAWVALAAVSGVGNSRINHDGGREAKIETVDETGASVPTTDGSEAPAAADAAAEPSADTAEPALPDAIVNGGQVLGPPPGPKTAAEEKADSVLACMDGCQGQVACQNSCITTGYNVPVGPVPSVTASIPPPLATVTPANAASTAPVAATTAGTTPKAQGSGAMLIGGSYGMGCAVVVVAVTSFFAGL